MKAAVLKSFGSPLVIETVPDPILGTGEVIVDVVATGVAGYAGEVHCWCWIMRNCISIHGQRMYPRNAVSRMVGLRNTLLRVR